MSHSCLVASPRSWTKATAMVVIEFEINVGGADFRESPNGPEADELEVTIVYTDTESTATLFEKTFRP